jgi:HK97 gp10 family phage protein
VAIRSRLEWRGDEVEARVVAASIAGINLTLARCLALAIPRAPIRTGNLRGSGFIRPAIPALGTVIGAWGFSAGYAAYVELGTRFMAARPFMRPAMDVEYPQLGRRIRAAMK